jgi:hypothetical protein
MYDEKEQDRLEHIEILKAKGKGAPKKKKSAAGKCSMLHRSVTIYFDIC